MTLSSWGYSQTHFGEDEVQLRQRVRAMLLDQQYAELEHLISDVRKHQSRSVTGSSYLEVIYDELGSPMNNANDRRSAIHDRKQILGAWNRSKPSMAAHIALAYCFQKEARDARGGGLAGTVSGDAVDIIERAISQAEEALRRAAAMAEDDGVSDPCIPAMQMRLGLYAGYDRNRMQRYLDKSLDIDPWFTRPIDSMALYLLPRWHGRPGDLIDFADECAAATKSQIGETAYAIVALNAFDYKDESGFHPDGQFHWPRVRQGLIDWLQQNPDSPTRLAAAAHLAHIAGDRLMARDMIERLEGRWPTSVWPKEVDYQRTMRWAFDDGQPTKSLRVIEFGPTRVQKIGVVNQGEDFIAPTFPYRIPVYQIETGKRSREIPFWPDSIECVATHAVSGTIDLVVHSKRQHVLKRANINNADFETVGVASASVYHVATSSDGKGIATSDTEGNLKYWQIEDSPLPYEWTNALTDGAAGIAFAPDGKRLLAGSGRTLKVWDTQSRELLLQWDAHPQHLFDLAWSPDGQTIASAGVGPDITLWNANDGSEQARTTVNAESIASLAFSPDSKLLIAGTFSLAAVPNPGQVLVYDIVKAKLIESLSGHRMNVLKVVVTPDGKQILSASDDGSARVWRMPTQ
ncbi:WD40 repeat domain-containing protein [Novipirellula sp.]|uniref:WD40 repeat domain-containing protein n=1 Tax=Novipirellula sp. TaxID=2795430 RepID=UPI00356A3AC5